MSTIGPYLLLFLLVWLDAVLRTFNNLHIMRLQTKTAIPFNLMGAFVNMFVVLSIVELGWPVFIPVGLGYGVGQIAAMKIFRWRRERSSKEIPVEDDIE